MNIIINKAAKLTKAAAEVAVEECMKLSTHELKDLLHECETRLVTAKGSQAIAIKIVQAAAQAVLEG